MFVGFDDDQPQVHEVGSSTESEVHITSMKCPCERCKMSPLSAAPSSSEFCGSKLLLASLKPPPISHASETCSGTWEIAVASLEPPPMPSASRICSDLWKIDCYCIVAATANPFCFKGLPRSPVWVSWRGRSRSYDVGNLRAVLRRHIFCRGVANSLGGWIANQKAAANIFLDSVTELKNVWNTVPLRGGRTLDRGFRSCRRELFLL